MYDSVLHYACAQKGIRKEKNGYGGINLDIVAAGKGKWYKKHTTSI